MCIRDSSKNGGLKCKQTTESATEKYFWACIKNQHHTKKFRQNYRVSDSNLLEILESVGWREMKIFVIAASFSWEDKHFSSFILDKVLDVSNKRNQVKIKGIKVYNSKQSMTSSGSIKTKIYKWQLALATLWYKIEDHQDLSSSWKWRIFTFSSRIKCKSLQIYFLLSALKHKWSLCLNW